MSVGGDTSKGKIKTHNHEAERGGEEAPQHETGGPADDHPDQPPCRHRPNLNPGGHGTPAFFTSQMVQLDLGLTVVTSVFDEDGSVV